MRDTFALGGGPYHFFARSSRRAAASSICSAKSFFSLAFSSSSCLSRLASGDVHAAVLGLPVIQRRFRDAVLAREIGGLCPASCSRSTPLICSSVNLPRFLFP